MYSCLQLYLEWCHHGEAIHLWWKNENRQSLYLLHTLSDFNCFDHIAVYYVKGSDLMYVLKWYLKSYCHGNVSNYNTISSFFYVMKFAVILAHIITQISKQRQPQEFTKQRIMCFVKHDVLLVFPETKICFPWLSNTEAK